MRSRVCETYAVWWLLPLHPLAISDTRGPWLSRNTAFLTAWSSFACGTPCQGFLIVARVVQRLHRRQGVSLIITIRRDQAMRVIAAHGEAPISSWQELAPLLEAQRLKHGCAAVCMRRVCLCVQDRNMTARRAQVQSPGTPRPSAVLSRV